MTDDAKTELTADQVFAEQAQERAALAELIVAAAQPKHEATPRGPWRVLSQSGRHEDVVCAHRFELIADLCAIRRANRGRRETGVFYTVRRAES